MHKSIATINSPEFINLQPLDINPLMSSCEIKVLYLGENRNHSFITKEVATEMAKTLRGAPIVGYYREDKEDFVDHGEQLIIDDEGVKFKCLTTPYGFVSPDAKVWFQTFEDTNDFGEVVEREYLMTTGYLWTGQFEECKLAIDESRPQSMELDEETLQGHWSTKNNGMDFFIINDAVFSKLCILGEDVEPCFEGANVSAPKVSSSFTKMNDEFRKTLFTMMQELQFALQGGQQMEDQVINTVDTDATEEIVADPVEKIDEPVAEEEITETVIEESLPVSEDADGAEEGIEEPSVEEPIQIDNIKEEVEIEEKPDENSDVQSGEEVVDEFALLQEKYSKLQSEYTELQEKYTALEESTNLIIYERNQLLDFKAKIEDAEKDAMIEKFCFLSEEDKKDVIENKAKYTLEEIESKLCVISVRKQVNFNLDDSTKNEINTEKDIFTYNLSNDIEQTPAWIRAVKNTQNKK